MNGKMEDLEDVTVVATSGKKYKLSQIAGNGSQGIVYEETSGKIMVKLYYPSGNQTIDEEVLERLYFIMNIKMPKNFVSIIDVIEFPYIGYVMEKVTDHVPLNTFLIPDKNKGFADWYNEGYGLRGRIFVGYIIAKAFSELEINNLSYCDISGNNIFVNVSKNASIKLIDVDNIYVAGKGKAAILGTPRYIAPEVINRQKNPDVLSDNYSLAVILFELLRIGHPYISDDVIDGTPEDEDAALAGKYAYVTDDNSTNMLPADLVLTDKLKELFRRCFEDGRKNRLRRPSAAEFEKALLEASNKVIKCPSCGAWHYPRKVGRTYEGCPWCDAESRPKAMLNFYDTLFDGDSYKTGKIIGEKKSGDLVNSYVLRDGKNFVKSLYVLRFDDVNKERRSAENYFTIAKDDKGFHVYNEFSKEGIIVKKYGTEEYVKVPARKAFLLKSGDQIYFEISGNEGINIDCGGKQYSFIRMARFMEVSE